MKKTAFSAKVVFLLISVTLCSLAMCYVDAVIQPQYFVKSAIKILLFSSAPILYFSIWRDRLSAARALFRPKLRSFLMALGMGVAVYAVILVGYLCLRHVVDFSGIMGKLNADAGVNAENFVYVSLYISLVNSFLEELLFRGFAFITFKRHASRRSAYVFSSAAFAVYHAGMTFGYFNLGIFLLTLGALFAVGLIFDFLNERSENIYTSWLVHMFANFAINTVGFILLGIL